MKCTTDKALRDLQIAVIKYFNERPALSVSGIEREAKFVKGTLNTFLLQRRKLNNVNAYPLIVALVKYGFMNGRGWLVNEAASVIEVDGMTWLRNTDDILNEINRYEN